MEKLEEGKIIFNGCEFPHLEYLGFNKASELKQTLGAIRWIELKAVGQIELEEAGMLGYPLLREIYAIKDSKGIYIDYAHGFEFDKYFMKPKEIMVKS